MNVAALIVSSNRSKLLTEALEAVISQSCPPKVLIIFDNNSNEDVLESILNHGYFVDFVNTQLDYDTYRMQRRSANNVVEVLFLKAKENLGSAGALNVVFRDFSSSFEWLWIMDDDGLPSKTCLENLYSYSSNYKYICPVVISAENKSELSFSLNRVKKIQDLSTISQDGVIFNYANPWNGLLLSTDVIKSVGLPCAGMFIWGEEIEYLERVKKKFVPITVLNSIFYHPKDRLIYNVVFCGIGFVLPENLNRRFIFYRNQSYILYRYNFRKWVLFLIRYSFLFLFLRKLDFNGFILFSNAVLIGLRGKYA